MRRFAGMLTTIGLFASLTAACSDDRDDSARLWEPTEVDRQTCPESRFECVTITVPRDHFGSDDTTWEITYAIQPAAVERRGTFVTITGGPGTAGIYSADGYTDVMAQQITDYNDIVFLNQRGSGDSVPVRCDEAVTEYYTTPLDIDADDLDASVDSIDATLRTFVDDCMAEGDLDPEQLEYYSTRQAVEDLEAVRRHLDVEQMILYGESYGTQFVQTYAAAHPSQVEALMVDGVVDLAVDGRTWYREAARAHDDALTATFAACVADELCAVDAGAEDADDLGAAFDELGASLADGPIEFEFPLADGSTEVRELTSGDLETAAIGNVGSFTWRMHLLRALNSAAAGNYVPLDTLADQYLFIDPQTQELEPDPSWSDALYYAVECQDYSYYPGEGTPEQRLSRWLSDYIASGTDDLRLGSVALGDLPCLYWPNASTDTERPEPILDPPYPTFVLTADTDAATPMVSAMRVFSRLTDAYLIVLEGGPHVIFDWGYPCVDDPISDFLGDGTLPPTRVTICDGDVIDPYVQNAPTTAGEIDADDREGVAAGIVDQLTYNAEYSAWDGLSTLAIGCDFGGSVTYEPTDVDIDVVLEACELTDGYPIDGSGSIDVDGIVTAELTTPDDELTVVDDGETTTVD